MVELYPHQRNAVNKLRNGSILWGGVGSGKSLTAVAYYVEKEAPKNVYVITTAKKRDHLDWEGDFAKYGIGKAADATTAGILHVDSWNQLWRYTDVEGAFFIFDEQRLVGAGDWATNFIKIAAKNHWILLSATPGDTWMDYIPVFIANGFYPNRTTFKREHVIYNPYTKFPKVDRYVNTSKLVKYRNSILVHMPYPKQTVRNSIDVGVEYDRELFNEVLNKKWNPWENRPLRDVAELFSVMRRVANSHASRLAAVKRILSRHPRLIVFYNFDYELDILRTLSDTKSTENSTTPEMLLSFVVAEWNGHKHQMVPDTESWVYLVQYAAGSEGWNCTATDATCFYSLPYSYKMFEQAHGRIDRMNTPFKDLYYYTLWGGSMIEHAIRKALSAKQNFNESRFLARIGAKE